MKTFLALLTSLYSFAALGQNYQCLQSSVRHYFINSHSYLRGIRIDSVKTFSDSTIYYPFRTPRGSYSESGPGSIIADTTSGSWLGKKVIQLTNGTFLFDNLWGDTVVIKTQANIGDSWIFCRDTSALYYQAELTGMDTMTISGTLDSVKTILITAHNLSGLVATDPVDSFQIILSKNNGFVQIFDLYTFPYHTPGSAYTGGLDFYLDLIGGPASANSIFTLVVLINPAYRQLYDWEIGDVFENSVCNPDVYGDCLYPYIYYLDTITSKVVSPGNTQYNFSGWVATQVFPAPPLIYFPDYNYPYKFSSQSGTLTFSNDLLIDTTLMPEEWLQPNFLFYNPNDTQYCLKSCMYQFGQSSIEGDMWYHFSEGTPRFQFYKLGIGLVRYNYRIGLGPTGLDETIDTTIRYYYKSATSCGEVNIPYPPSSIYNTIKPGEAFEIYPNPANEYVTIEAVHGNRYDVVITDVLGRIIWRTSMADKVQIPVSNWQAGIYYVQVMSENGFRKTEKLIIF